MQKNPWTHLAYKSIQTKEADYFLGPLSNQCYPKNMDLSALLRGPLDVPPPVHRKRSLCTFRLPASARAVLPVATPGFDFERNMEPFCLCKQKRKRNSYLLIAILSCLKPEVSTNENAASRHCCPVAFAPGAAWTFGISSKWLGAR